MPSSSEKTKIRSELNFEVSEFLSEFNSEALVAGGTRYALTDIVEGGQALLAEEQFESATAVLECALKKWPANPALNGVLADCYCRMGKFDKSSTHFEFIFKNSKTVPFWALVGYANVQEKLGNNIQACQYLENAVKQKYSLDVAKRALRLSTFGGVTGEVAQSIIVSASESTETAETRAEHFRVLGDLLMKLEHYSLGFEFYDDSHLADNSRILPVTRKIKYLIRSNRVAQAKIVIENWKETWPGDSKLRRFERICADTTIADTVRTVAFYLPQYHPVPENDEWWGEGFTEWRNVAAATGMWDGHSQPRLPTDLGYYDLRLPEVYNKQTRLATEYGIDGFCFYYYWFNGRKILERPLQNILGKKTEPFPFCICWVNEDWTRSWDGMTGEVLLSTEHSLEMNTRFIEDVYPILADENYIRIENKPVLSVYCAEKLDLTDATTAIWREYCRAQGLGEIYICAVQSFGFGDPTALGYDAALEFPPHAIPSSNDNDSHIEIENIDGLAPNFKGKVYSYQNFADCAMSRPKEKYTLHRTCMLAWDNTARRGKQAHVYAHFSVGKYQQWLLTNMRKAVVEQKDPVVFVNAWNEWAEGSTLEPDAEFGNELLAASRRAKRVALWNNYDTYWKPQINQPLVGEVCRNEKILMIGHDAHRNGAQINFLCMLQNLVREKKKRVTVILKEGGDLVPQYEQYGKVYVIGSDENRYGTFQAIIRDYHTKGVTKAICNTCVTGDLTFQLHATGYSVVTLIHELPGLIEQYGLMGNCESIATHADSVVFASDYVAEKFSEIVEIRQDKVHVYMQGIKPNPYIGKSESVKADVRAEFGIPASGKLVIGCGYGDIRKGIDLFVQLARTVSKNNPDSYFIWIGEIDDGLRSYLDRDIAEVTNGRLIVTGYREDTGRILVAGEVFALTSREDPFPSVLMEAMEAGLAVFAFDNCGGYNSIVNNESGGIVPFGDLANYAKVVDELLVNTAKHEAISNHNTRYAVENFGYKNYISRLLELAHSGYAENPHIVEPKVTAIIPNYNYALYLNLRLKTVFSQSRPPDEIIILDDASSDNSLQIIRDHVEGTSIKVLMVENDCNSGNVFVQWKKGLEMATGDLIWIAEADDYCDQDFLRRMCVEFAKPNVSMAMSNSVMVDEFGGSHGVSYDNYYTAHFGDYFETDFTKSGRSFVNEVMTRRNAVMNASAVVFRHSRAIQAMRNLGSLKLSGDWLFWIELCMTGDISYIRDTYNYHRRHRKSVLGQALKEKTKIVAEMLVLLDEVYTRYGEELNDESFDVGFGSIVDTYRELFTDENGCEPIESHPVLASEYSRLRGLIYPVLSSEAILLESPEKQAVA